MALRAFSVPIRGQPAAHAVFLKLMFTDYEFHFALRGGQTQRNGRTSSGAPPEITASPGPIS